MAQNPYGRKDRLIKEKRHDTYFEKEKLAEPTRCPVCQALFSNGRWTWKKVSEKTEVHQATCPACRRITDNYPAGYIEIRGEFFTEHRSEIENLIHNVEEQEKARHPLQRLISITVQDNHTLVTTTGIHLARRIGEAVTRSCKGELSIHYGAGEQSIRVYCQR